MKTTDKVYITFFFLLIHVSIYLAHVDTQKQIQQSKEHHKHYHELIKENYQYEEWYQNHSNNTDCDTFRQPNSVSIQCDKYEL